MDYQQLHGLRRSHPAWKLLAADHAPLIIGFLHHSFIRSNTRSLAEQELAARLEDYLFQLRERLGPEAFPKRAIEYLNDWTGDARGWLRKYYPERGDEAHFDLTSAAECSSPRTRSTAWPFPTTSPLVIFGLAYGLDRLADIPWLQRAELHYWGDIDTHGFAILNRLRATLPRTRSLLMDRATLDAS